MLPNAVLAEELNETKKEETVITEDVTEQIQTEEIVEKESDEALQENISILEETSNSSLIEGNDVNTSEEIGSITTEEVTEEGGLSTTEEVVVEAKNETISKESGNTSPIDISNKVVKVNGVILDSLSNVNVKVGDIIDVTFNIENSSNLNFNGTVDICPVNDNLLILTESMSSYITDNTFHYTYTVTANEAGQSLQYYVYIVDENNNHAFHEVLVYNVDPISTLHYYDYYIVSTVNGDYNFYINQKIKLRFRLSSKTEISEVRYGLISNGVEYYSATGGVLGQNSIDFLLPNLPTDLTYDVFVTATDINGFTLTQVLGQLKCMGYPSDMTAPVISNIVATSGTVELGTILEVNLDISDDSWLGDFTHRIRTTDGTIDLFYTGYGSSSAEDGAEISNNHYFDEYYLTDNNSMRNKTFEYYVSFCDIYQNCTGDILITTVHVVDSSAPVDFISFSTNKNEYYFNEQGYAEFELTGNVESVRADIFIQNSNGTNYLLATTDNAVMGYNRVDFEISKYRSIETYNLYFQLSKDSYYYMPYIGTFTILGYSSDTVSPTISNVVATNGAIYAGETFDVSFDITDESSMESVKKRSKYVIRSVDPWDSTAPYINASEYISIDGKYHHSFIVPTDYIHKVLTYSVELCDEFGNEKLVEISRFTVWDPTDVTGPTISNFEAQQTTFNYYDSYNLKFTFDAEDPAGIDTTNSYIQYYLDKNTTIKDYSIRYNSSTGKY